MDLLRGPQPPSRVDVSFTYPPLSIAATSHGARLAHFCARGRIGLASLIRRARTMIMAAHLCALRGTHICTLLSSLRIPMCATLRSVARLIGWNGW
jgi:hypothetical protein